METVKNEITWIGELAGKKDKEIFEIGKEEIIKAFSKAALYKNLYWAINRAAEDIYKLKYKMYSIRNEDKKIDLQGFPLDKIKIEPSLFGYDVYYKTLKLIIVFPNGNERGLTIEIKDSLSSMSYDKYVIAEKEIDSIKTEIAPAIVQGVLDEKDAEIQKLKKTIKRDRKLIRDLKRIIG